MTIPAIYNLYSKIILEALSVSPIKLNKCRRDFMIEIFMLNLNIPSRINFLQLGRYGLHGEQRYRRQFEKEFDFMDAKQFAGLENAQARSENKLYFHFNTALTMVNVLRVMQLSNPDTMEVPFLMKTHKTLFHNVLLLSRFICLFAINPDSIKNHQHVKDLLYFGTMAA